MGSDTRSSILADSFSEALHSEIVAGSDSLSGWVQYLDASGAIDLLFELESRLRGLRSFFDIRHLPLGETERAGLVDRSFAAELGIARETIQLCERFSAELIRIGQPRKVEFESFIESQLRRDGALDYHVSWILEQPTPLDSLARLMECLNDLRVLIDAAERSGGAGYQVFLSIGRCFLRGMRNCRYVDMLLSQRFRVQYDRVDNAALSGILRGIHDDRLRRHLALSFLHLYRLRKYLGIISRDLLQDRPLHQTLVIFALLHEEIEVFSDFLKARFLRGRDTGHSLWQTAELIVYSLKMESQRALQQELHGVAREVQAPVIYVKVENSHGLLRNCFESSVVALARNFDKNLAGRAIFPSMVDSLQEAQRLRQDLWDLRQYMKGVLEKSEAASLEAIVEQLAHFRESSLRYLMYRDWAEFEHISDALVAAGNPMEVRVLLRKFVSFLEALAQEVSKRSVFQVASEIPSPAH